MELLYKWTFSLNICGPPTPYAEHFLDMSRADGLSWRRNDVCRKSIRFLLDEPYWCYCAGIPLTSFLHLCMRLFASYVYLRGLMVSNDAISIYSALQANSHKRSVVFLLLLLGRYISLLSLLSSCFHWWTDDGNERIKKKDSTPWWFEKQKRILGAK